MWDRDDEGVRPVPIAYASGNDLQPRRPLSAGRILLQFFGGLTGGMGLSALLWTGALNHLSQDGLVILLGLIAVKMVIATIFFLIPGWRMTGGGMLLSLAIGMLVFFYVCARDFRFR